MGVLLPFVPHFIFYGTDDCSVALRKSVTNGKLTDQLSAAPKKQKMAYAPEC